MKSTKKKNLKHYYHKDFSIIKKHNMYNVYIAEI